MTPAALPATDVRRAAGIVGALTPPTVVSTPGRQTDAAGSTIVRGVRILLVTPGLGLGGSERLTLAYARGLVARGHDVLVVHGPPERFSDADVEGISRRRLSGRPTPAAIPRLVPLAALDRAGVPAGRRAHAVGAVDADGRDRASSHAAGHHGPRHRGVGGARRGPAAARRPSARHRRLRGLRRGRQASSPGAERRARAARRRHRATRARRARSRRPRRFPSAGRASRASRATFRSRASTCSSKPSPRCSKPSPAPASCWSAAARTPTS